MEKRRCLNAELFIQENYKVDFDKGFFEFCKEKESFDEISRTMLERKGCYQFNDEKVMG